MTATSAVLAIILFIALAMAGVYTLYNLIVNFQPGRNKIKADIKHMKEEMEPFMEDLVPLGREELDLLSLNQINQSRKKGWLKSFKGVFTTIYHEPVIAYAYKRYMGKKENALLYARTTEHEFVYHLKGGKVHIEVDGAPLGELRDNARLYGARKQQLLAEVNRQSNDLLLPVQVLDREVGHIVRPEKARRTNPRAYELLAPMKKEEELILLSLTVLEAVGETVKRKNEK